MSPLAPSRPAKAAGRPTRRQVVAGAAGAGLGVALGGLSVPALARAPDPELGPNVFVVDPAMPAGEVQARLDAIFARQERAHFTDERYAVLFKPGRYAVDANVGFFTQVAGLGRLPGDVAIDGHVHVEADWHDGMALVNFWRGVENLTVRPPDGADRWAVSQAAPYRRVHLVGDLALDDGGWSSGGFLADCRIDGVVRSGTQQQWFTRSSTIGGWQGANWNMVFAGVEGAPPTTFPDPPVTTLQTAPRVREKPFLSVDDEGGWSITVPAVRRDGRGHSWADGPPPARTIPFAEVFVARPGDGAARMNAALSAGRHLLLTPGVYRLAQPLRVDRPGAVVLGLGLATLLAEGGTAAIEVADVPGVAIAGLLVDAGPERSPVLVRVGPREAAGTRPDHRDDPVSLSDLYVRVGGATIGRVGTAVEINARGVLADHLWIWRADHGDPATGRVHVGWDESTGEHGLVVNGDDVVCTGLFVEHFQRTQTLWTGERGRTLFYQNELPYDPPSQQAFRPGPERGWPAYQVADTVRWHDATALGVYANFTADPSIVLGSAVEVPDSSGVVVRHVTTISLGGGQGTIAHLVNDAGEAARPGAVRQTLLRYPADGGGPT